MSVTSAPGYKELLCNDLVICSVVKVKTVILYPCVLLALVQKHFQFVPLLLFSFFARLSVFYGTSLDMF